MVYLFVIDNSLTSQRFTTRTEQLTSLSTPEILCLGVEFVCLLHLMCVVMYFS